MAADFHHRRRATSAPPCGCDGRCGGGECASEAGTPVSAGGDPGEGAGSHAAPAAAAATLSHVVRIGSSLSVTKPDSPDFDFDEFLATVSDHVQAGGWMRPTVSGG